jgi:diacylglycerol kinase
MLKKKINSFRYAFRGIGIALKEPNMKIHIMIASLVVSAGILLNLSPTEWMVISVVISLVIICEMINTAIEHLVDLISPELHPKAGIIKDLCAGAVLIAAICAVVIAIFIFIPKFAILL